MKRNLTLFGALIVLFTCTIVTSAQSAAMCGIWLNGCTRMAYNAYNMCISGGGANCESMAYERLNACIDEIENAGCDKFPSNCYTFDIRQPYAKECGQDFAEIQTLEELVAETLRVSPTNEEEAVECEPWLTDCKGNQLKSPIAGDDGATTAQCNLWLAGCESVATTVFNQCMAAYGVPAPAGAITSCSDLSTDNYNACRNGLINVGCNFTGTPLCPDGGFRYDPRTGLSKCMSDWP